ncbi:unnamed protein product [Tenebrio molitor]|nr:unnamed protein product [Tenebrio molitor]
MCENCFYKLYKSLIKLVAFFYRFMNKSLSCICSNW